MIVPKTRKGGIKLVLIVVRIISQMFAKKGGPLPFDSIMMQGRRQAEGHVSYLLLWWWLAGAHVAAARKSFFMVYMLFRMLVLVFRLWWCLRQQP